MEIFLAIFTSFFSIFILVSPISSLIVAQEKMIVGLVEKVSIYPGNIFIRAKVDTGTKTCSLDASHLIEFERDNEKWVRFKVTNHLEKTISISRKVERVVKIKEHKGPLQRRPVVLLGICLGNIYKEVEVNLANRSNFNYKMLIGRNFMDDDIVVDPSLSYTTKPSCKGAIKE
jgi:hypothetical protein